MLAPYLALMLEPDRTQLTRGRRTPRLETPRLVLRPFAPDDWVAVDAMLSDPVTTRYMHFATWTEDQRRHWFAWYIAKGHEPDAEAVKWAIARRDSGEVIGWFGIGTSSEPTFGYLLGRAYWNEGYITQALAAVLAYEFDIRATTKLRATCNIANPALAR